MEKDKIRTSVVFHPTKFSDLTRLQAQLGEMGNFSPNAQGGLHLTYINFGMPGKLFDEIRQFAAISESDLNVSLRRLIEEMTAHPILVPGRISNLDIFGSPKFPVVSAEVELPELVTATRKLLIDKLFADLGDGLEFDWENQSRVLNWIPNKGYRPHIALGRSTEPIDIGDFGDLDIPIGLSGFYANNFRGLR